MHPKVWESHVRMSVCLQLRSLHQTLGADGTLSPLNLYTSPSLPNISLGLPANTHISVGRPKTFTKKHFMNSHWCILVQWLPFWGRAAYFGEPPRRGNNISMNTCFIASGKWTLVVLFFNEISWWNWLSITHFYLLNDSVFLRPQKNPMGRIYPQTSSLFLWQYT